MRIRRLIPQILIIGAGISLVGFAGSCKGRRAGDMVPTGDTVELVIKKNIPLPEEETIPGDKKENVQEDNHFERVPEASLYD